MKSLNAKQIAGLSAILSAMLTLASCGGGGGGSGGTGGDEPPPSAQPETFSIILTGMELKDTRNDRGFSVNNLPVNGATIIKD